MLLPFAGVYTVAPIEATFGSVACALGGVGRDDGAVSHLEAAVDLERRMRAQPWLARAKQQLATALLGRGTPLDRPRSTRRRSSTPPEGPSRPGP